MTAVISDTNILIDYIKVNKFILSITSKKLYKIIIPTPIFQEIKQLSQSEAIGLGLEIYEPSLIQITEASQRDGKLSFYDKLCFVVARDNKCICATNDKVLRKFCINNGIEIIWGFDIMLKLCEEKIINRKTAIDTAKAIYEINKLITEDILIKFIDKINKL